MLRQLGCVSTCRRSHLKMQIAANALWPKSYAVSWILRKFIHLYVAVGRFVSDASNVSSRQQHFIRNWISSARVKSQCCTVAYSPECQVFSTAKYPNLATIQNWGTDYYTPIVHFRFILHELRRVRMERYWTFKDDIPDILKILTYYICIIVLWNSENLIKYFY